MKIETIATLFSGGEGVGCGAKDAGLKHLWGIEYSDDIAQNARENGFNVITADVTKFNSSTLELPDILHASPPCPSFSVAKKNSKETKEDIAMAQATANFIESLLPKVFTLENVYGYRNSKSFELILRSLHNNGYNFRWWHINAADYGVPQSRKRLILIASRIFIPTCPLVTHQKNEENTAQLLYVSNLPKHVGWYVAIEDLLETLPDSCLAPWQLERLSNEFAAWINGNQKINNRGILVDSKNSRSAQPNRVEHITTRHDTDTAWTIPTSAKSGHIKSVLIPNDNASSFSIRYSKEPARTIGNTNKPSNAPKIIMIDRKPTNHTGDLQIKNVREPMITVNASSYKHIPKICSQLRVVQLTPQALARLQSFPNWYILPDKKALACKIIGNAVPSLLYQRIAEHIIKKAEEINEN